MRLQRHRRRAQPAVEVIRHVTRHARPELEIWPPRAEVTFSDERSANPANTMLRFEATVFNACSTTVRWEVLDPEGHPGAGSIDQTGLYRAPAFEDSLNGTTDVVTATLVEDPLRTAYAWVTLAGVGPWPTPAPRLQLVPKTAYLYYPDGHDNDYIDSSNTMQFFRVLMMMNATTDPYAAELYQSTSGQFHDAVRTAFEEEGPFDADHTAIYATVNAVLYESLRAWVMNRAPIQEVYDNVDSAVRLIYDYCP